MSKVNDPETEIECLCMYVKLLAKQRLNRADIVEVGKITRAPDYYYICAIQPLLGEYVEYGRDKKGL